VPKASLYAIEWHHHSEIRENSWLSSIVQAKIIKEGNKGQKHVSYCVKRLLKYMKEKDS